MKRHAFHLLSLLTLLLVAGSAIAQSQRVAANVPFDFKVGDKALPAGSYSIEALSSRDSRTLFLRSEDSGSGLMVGSNTAQNVKPASKTKLVFDRYGDQYFLSQIWVEGATIGRQLPKTAREKELANSMAQGLKPDKVELVATLH